MKKRQDVWPAPRCRLSWLPACWGCWLDLAVCDYFISNVSNCDRWVLAHFGGLEAVGYFALATMAREAICKVPDALGEYIYPRMSHSYGQHHDPARLWRMAVKSSLLVVAFMVP